MKYMKYILSGWIRTINHYHAGYLALSAVPGVCTVLGIEKRQAHLVPAWHFPPGPGYSGA